MDVAGPRSDSLGHDHVPKPDDGGPTSFFFQGLDLGFRRLVGVGEDLQELFAKFLGAVPGDAVDRNLDLLFDVDLLQRLFNDGPGRQHRFHGAPAEERNILNGLEVKRVVHGHG